MKKRLFVLVAASVAMLVAALTPAVAGATSTLCNLGSGYWAAGADPGEKNRVVAGFNGPDNAVAVSNKGTQDDGPPFNISSSCSGSREQGTWMRFEARLGDRDDFARTDAETLQEDSSFEFGPLPGRIRVRLFGEGGEDRLLGHSGPDRIEGGSGSDLARGFSGNDRIVGGTRSGPPRGAR